VLAGAAAPDPDTICVLAGKMMMSQTIKNIGKSELMISQSSSRGWRVRVRLTAA